VNATSSIGPVAEWAQTLTNHRQWVKSCIADEATAASFDSDTAVKLHTVISVAAALSPDNITGWQALGVVFGDVLSEVVGLPWGEIADEYGTDPCLVISAANDAVVFPMTMLSKRVERGEAIGRETITQLLQ
jgi:hypothetical protein